MVTRDVRRFTLFHTMILRSYALVSRQLDVSWIDAKLMILCNAGGGTVISIFIILKVETLSKFKINTK